MRRRSEILHVTVAHGEIVGGRILQIGRASHTAVFKRCGRLESVGDRMPTQADFFCGARFRDTPFFVTFGLQDVDARS